MPRNIEVKARMKDRAVVEARLAALQLECDQVIQQHDTFYHSAQGRLKLRRFADQSAELIYYERDDQSDAKESFYLQTKTRDANNLHESLCLANGVRGEVKKVRHLYLHGRTRIHLDKVDGLGDYLELEVVMRDEEDNEVGVTEANDLLQQLGIPQSDCLECAYVDLLAMESS